MEESWYNDHDWMIAKQQSARSWYRNCDTTIAIWIEILYYNTTIAVTIVTSQYTDRDRDRETAINRFAIQQSRLWEEIALQAKIVAGIEKIAIVMRNLLSPRVIFEKYCSLDLFISRVWWRGNIEQSLKSCLSKCQRCNDIITGATDAFMVMQISTTLFSERKINAANSLLKMERK